VMDADVIILGAGPTGLMLACELRLAGVRPLVLERQPQIRDIPKAGGLSGQILQLLRYRGELERFEAASTAPRPAPRFPWGGMHVDFTQLADPPMQALPLPQPRLERVLDELARELGAEIRRGQEVVGLSQDDATVTADVRGADGPDRVTARYLVGCDGARSPVRDMAGIPFPGITYPEVQRLAVVTVPESVNVLENGDLDVAGVGRISFGFTRTDRGEFAVGSTNPALLGLFTSEDESADYDDDEPMTLTELRDSIRRVLGVDLPLGEPTRLTRFTFHARQVERYRDGRILLAGDAAHLFPAPRRRTQRRPPRHRQPRLEAGRRHPRLGAGRPAGHVPRRTPPRRRTYHAARASPGRAAARPRPGRRSTPGALPGTARRRAAVAPHRRSYGRLQASRYAPGYARERVLGLNRTI
jgi:2-polyprenyl-6-methoxyphenol hydroxylase-like FAD-dependent oxidoreductase